MTKDSSVRSGGVTVLPCPSGCDTARLMINAADGWHVRYVQCGCGWRSREFVYLEATLAEREAIDAWNKRPALHKGTTNVQG